jgi:hypothetical protein
LVTEISGRLGGRKIPKLVESKFRPFFTPTQRIFNLNQKQKIYDYLKLDNAKNSKMLAAAL